MALHFWCRLLAEQLGAYFTGLGANATAGIAASLTIAAERVATSHSSCIPSVVGLAFQKGGAGIRAGRSSNIVSGDAASATATGTRCARIGAVGQWTATLEVAFVLVLVSSQQEVLRGGGLKGREQEQG